MDSCCAAQRNGGSEGGEALLITRFAGEESACQTRGLGMVCVGADNGDGRQGLRRARG